MLARSFVALSIAIATAAMPVIADMPEAAEPVLRLRLTDPISVAASGPILRPRLSDNVTDKPAPVPMPDVTLNTAGRVGKFAQISTPHPNLVVTVGATRDTSEIGRQIDRAILEMTRGDLLFNRQSDSAPFLGLGVRSGSPQGGWSADAAIGVGVFNPPDHSRLYGPAANVLAAPYQTEASAHFKLQYTF